MEYHILPDGRKVPLLGMGTWGMGGYWERDESSAAQSIVALRTGIKYGMCHVDTAEIYGAGLAEELVKRAISGLKRENIILTSKFWNYAKSKDIVSAVKGSLSRLGVNYLDFCLAHRPPADNCYEDLVSAFQTILDEGLAKRIGVSNFTLEQLVKTKKLLRNKVISAVQIEYNVQNQTARSEYFDYCRRNRILVMAYRPLAKGAINAEKSEVLQKIAAKYNKTISQLALRWIIQQKGVVAIPKAVGLQHLSENMGAIGWLINDEDMDILSNYSEV